MSAKKATTVAPTSPALRVSNTERNKARRIAKAEARREHDKDKWATGTRTPRGSARAARRSRATEKAVAA